MLHYWNITIPELTGEETRRAYIYLPDSYEMDEERRYPVLYMFDGHNVFLDEHATYGKSWGMKDYMDFTNTEIIIAAVECNHSPDHGRLKEYAPYTFEEPGFGTIEGKGEIYMNWLISTFKPLIDENFRTLPERECTMIAGSSMGGLMSLYAVLKHNDTFSRAACLSPSIWFGREELDALIETAELDPNTIIYMDYGSREMSFHKNMRKQYIKVVKLLLEREVFLESRIVPHGDHCEACWEYQIPFFMNTLLYDDYDRGNGMNEPGEYEDETRPTKKDRKDVKEGFYQKKTTAKHAQRKKYPKKHGKRKRP